MHPVYHAKITVSTKNFPRSEGRKCGVKGLVQWHGLMVWSRSWFRTTKGRERVWTATLGNVMVGDGLMVWSRSWFRCSSPRPNIANMYCTECIIGIIQNVHNTMPMARYGKNIWKIRW